jgi:hypothetical protein
VCVCVLCVCVVCVFCVCVLCVCVLCKTVFFNITFKFCDWNEDGKQLVVNVINTESNCN